VVVEEQQKVQVGQEQTEQLVDQVVVPLELDQVQLELVMLEDLQFQKEMQVVMNNIHLDQLR
tara:strand:+ start:91 stop:276 length:186 start_codon:yes stop_codon:yes gene_type:complete